MITKTLNKKRRYAVCMDQKGLFSVAVVTALSMLNDKSKIIDCVEGGYAVLLLDMDIKQKTAIELALSDYLVSINAN